MHSSTNSGQFKITRYDGHSKVEIEFLNTGFKLKSNRNVVSAGQVKDRLNPSVHGVGFIGVGEFKTAKNGNRTKAYATWKQMLQRCYSEKYHARQPTYESCEVCYEWKNYQIFCAWFYENYPAEDGRWQLDKDIINEGNKIYSPDNCKFVTARENSIHSSTYDRKIRSPEGEIIEFRNVSEFCLSRKLSRKSIGNVLLGKRSEYEGWTSP